MVNDNPFFESALHWTIASMIAGAIAWGLVYLHARDSRPCNEKRCFVLLDKRLAAIEAELQARTADRYTGEDAKRDLLIMNNRIEALHREQLKARK